MQAALASDTAAPAASRPAWDLSVPREAPIRLQRTLQERTPDASGFSGTVQLQPGVSPLLQIALYFGAQLISSHSERARKAEEQELLVPTDQAAGSTVVMAETAAHKKYESQDDVNRVIRPYADALVGTSLHDLLQAQAGVLAQHGIAVLGPLTAPGPSTPATLHVVPRFVFGADQRSISVDAVVGAGAVPVDDKEAALAAAERRVLRVQVHGPAADGLDISEHWLQNQARPLREMLSSLLATALRTAVPLLGKPAPAGIGVQKTWRFRLASESHFVRGTLLESSCESVLIHSLQGHVVRMPAAALRDRDALPANCAS